MDRATQRLEHMRHSLAHLLAAAVEALYPAALPAIGPAIENGFYYDFDFGEVKLTPEDLPAIEAKMCEILLSWSAIEREEISESEARARFADNPYKTELINEIIQKGEKITLYHSRSGTHATSDNFSPTPHNLPPTTYSDLCRGGHVTHPNKEIPPGAFTLSHIAGAYWRGSEKNKMLTRIYGIAFATKTELNDYLARREDAKKRDHKKLGRDLDLFTFSDLVGSGLPLWTPKGTIMRHLLDDFVWELRRREGYERVEIPHITKKELYETSGHWDKFKDELFKITTREGHEFALKPMNCPHHTQIYARRQWSYRELPVRYANTTFCYRDEQTGELSGLSRVRAFSQDDAHVFCRYGDVKEEILKIWNIVTGFYRVCGFSLSPRLSLLDPTHPEKYLGSAEVWERAEEELRDIVKEKGATADEAVGEAAFYGPKVDFMARDSLGRVWQLATIQLDMNQPERFDLTCVNEKGEKERIVMIHAAIMGSLERYLSILIEHYAGAFPLWLAPVQLKILPIGETHRDYAMSILSALTSAHIRAELDRSDETLGRKIRGWKQEKVPYALVIGDQEVTAENAMLESRDKGKIGSFSFSALIEKLTREIAEKK